MKRGQCHTLLCHGFKPVDAENIKKKLGKKRYLQCLCSSSVQTKHVHMHIKHIWIPSLSSTCSFFVVSNYLAINSLFLCCHSSRMARFQFCLGLGVTAMMNTLHTHKKNQTSIIYYHSTYVNTHERSGGDSGRACGTPVTGNQEYPDYGLLLQKRTCV